MAGKSMADIWKQMEKQHGSEGLSIGSDEKTELCEVVSTGSYALDDALGIFGVPRGHIVQFAGFQSSGKTMMALSTIAQCQKEDPNAWCLYIDAEYTFDAAWASKLGVDTERLMIYKENNGTKIFERLVGQSSKTPGKKSKLGLLDMELEQGGTGLKIIVLDSVAAVQPPVEEMAQTGGQSMAAMARFLPPELRRITPLLAATNVALICINQLREKPGVMYGDPTVSPGGSALKFACSQMINLAKINSAESKIERNEEQVGHLVRCRIDKNKTSSPFKVAEVAIEYTKGVVRRGVELRDLGCKYGVIKRPNNRTYEYDGQSFNGKDAMSDYLEDETIQHKIWPEIQAAKKHMIESGIVIAEVKEETE
jgi:recombination protein RecA